MQIAVVAMQSPMETADVGTVVSHGATLCTRIPARVSTAGSAALHGTTAPGHSPAIVGCVSYVVGDGAVAVCVEEKLVTRFRLVVPRVLAVIVMLGSVVSRRVHKSDAISWLPTRDRLVAWPSPSSVPSAPAVSP